MIHIRNLPDCDQLIDNSELYREVTTYLLYCRMELLEYEDEEDVDEHDFNFLVLDAEDLPMLNDLGPLEEVVQISIKADGMVQTMYRIVFPTTVIFIPAEISEQISF
jgi:hypothetical protein